ncbi:hypothetical protein B0H63DRAFT_78899 [Podospora didyma]|uniref:Uncharacterized protein n=1 Tax=Podospora didyma TaxID=330526 RepID=A0AAE0K2V2_9PEZI|nr:hypothetical protein B0H63DRAFT_78899 [Podospora didyma]
MPRHDTRQPRSFDAVMLLAAHHILSLDSLDGGLQSHPKSHTSCHLEVFPPRIPRRRDCVALHYGGTHINIRAWQRPGGPQWSSGSMLIPRLPSGRRPASSSKLAALSSLHARVDTDRCSPCSPRSPSLGFVRISQWDQRIGPLIRLWVNSVVTLPGHPPPALHGWARIGWQQPYVCRPNIYILWRQFNSRARETRPSQLPVSSPVQSLGFSPVTFAPFPSSTPFSSLPFTDGTSSREPLGTERRPKT